MIRLPRRALVALLLGLLVAGSASAHDLPYSLATVEISNERYELQVRCHTAALVLGLPQTHLAPAARSALDALPDEQLALRAQRMTDYLGTALRIEVDGRPLNARVLFPSVAAIRADGEQTPATAEPSEPIRITGRLPPQATRIALRFPPDLGTVVVRVVIPGREVSVQTLVAGEFGMVADLLSSHRARAFWPARADTALAYARLGIAHILTGPDHLLFVLGLLLLVRGRWELFTTVTAFTVAHSITLALATFDVVSLPRPLLDVGIAASILWLGVDVFRMRRGSYRPSAAGITRLAFAFGLLHGIGMSAGLTALGLPRSELPLALALFNVGVEVGQLLFIALAVALTRAFRVLEIASPRWAAAAPAWTLLVLGTWWTAYYAYRALAY